MRPCTSHTWQMRQVPYTTYRPVYHTETYQVPVTTSMCAPTCAPSIPTMPFPAAVGLPTDGCATCAGGIAAGSAIVPQGTLSTQGTYTSAPFAGVQNTYPATVQPSYGTPTPADLAPSLTNPQTLQKPVIIERRVVDPATVPGTSSSSYAPIATPPNAPPAGGAGSSPYLRDPQPASRWNETAPELLEDQTARHPAVEPWTYSPMRLAGHLEAVPRTQANSNSAWANAVPTIVHGTVQAVPSGTAAVSTAPNAGWRTGTK
jgi:hypothetical protein